MTKYYQIGFCKSPHSFRFTSGIISLLLLFFIFPALAQEPTVLERAEKEFLEGNTAQARILYLNALNSHPSNADIYLNLGLLYELENDYRSALTYYNRGLPHAGQKRSDFYRNLGNAHFMLGEYAESEEMYSKGIDIAPGEGELFLNRANARVKLGSFPEATTDYKAYLSLAPDAAQRDEIERMIILLARVVREREEQQIAKEALRIEEEERQRRLLESVLDSLSGAGTETRHLSAGSEPVTRTPIDIDIMD